MELQRQFDELADRLVQHFIQIRQRRDREDDAFGLLNAFDRTVMGDCDFNSRTVPGTNYTEVVVGEILDAFFLYRTLARGTLTFSTWSPRQSILVDDRRSALSLCAPRRGSPTTLRLVTRILDLGRQICSILKQAEHHLLGHALGGYRQVASRQFFGTPPCPSRLDLRPSHSGFCRSLAGFLATGATGCCRTSWLASRSGP
jgi:hypothetical protein